MDVMHFPRDDLETRRRSWVWQTSGSGEGYRHVKVRLMKSGDGLREITLVIRVFRKKLEPFHRAICAAAYDVSLTPDKRSARENLINVLRMPGEH